MTSVHRDDAAEAHLLSKAAATLMLRVTVMIFLIILLSRHRLVMSSLRQHDEDAATMTRRPSLRRILMLSQKRPKERRSKPATLFSGLPLRSMFASSVSLPIVQYVLATCTGRIWLSLVSRHRVVSKKKIESFGLFGKPMAITKR